jgi:hypothetical protein
MNSLFFRCLARLNFDGRKFAVATLSHRGVVVIGELKRGMGPWTPIKYFGGVMPWEYSRGFWLSLVHRGTAFSLRTKNLFRGCLLYIYEELSGVGRIGVLCQNPRLPPVGLLPTPDGRSKGEVQI